MVEVIIFYSSQTFPYVKSYHNLFLLSCLTQPFPNHMSCTAFSHCHILHKTFHLLIVMFYTTFSHCPVLHNVSLCNFFVISYTTFPLVIHCLYPLSCFTQHFALKCLERKEGKKCENLPHHYTCMPAHQPRLPIGILTTERMHTENSHIIFMLFFQR